MSGHISDVQTLVREDYPFAYFIHHNYRSLYFQVIDSIKCILSERFPDCESFAFLDLVKPCTFRKWRNKECHQICSNPVVPNLFVAADR